MITEIIIYIMLAAGVFFNMLAGVGLLRFPDVYTRLHAGTKCTTFGSIFIIGALILLGLKALFLEGDTDSSILVIHSGVALAAILLTNPTGAHALARAAYKSGVKPVGAVVDDLEKKPKKVKTVNVEKEIDKKLSKKEAKK